MKHCKRGLVIGKFLPPHRGHSYLIGTALQRVEELTVIVCERAEEISFLPGELRASWLRELFPAARVLVIEDVYDENDSRLWAQKTLEWLGQKPDVVFTSENYGAAYAEYLGCHHALVDLNRTLMPISATQIRANPYQHWSFLEAPVRAHFARRVVILGAESSGTTTLAYDLAKHFNTVCVPEFGRDYCEEKYARGDTVWRSHEFSRIAREQARRENVLAREANRVLICDTNAFATRIWHHRYCGFFTRHFDDEFVAARRAPDLYLLTNANIPFEQDGSRDGEQIRGAMHEKFVEELAKQKSRWELVSGSRKKRLQIAAQFVEELLA